MKFQTITAFTLLPQVSVHTAAVLHLSQATTFVTSCLETEKIGAIYLHNTYGLLHVNPHAGWVDLCMPVSIKSL